MTVCVAGICNISTAIVAVSDHQLSYGGIVSADVPTAMKAYFVHPRWLAMFAGNDIGNVRPILDRVKAKLSDLPQDQQVTRIDVAREFRGAFRAHLRTIIEERVLAPFDMSVRDFRTEGYQQFGATAFEDLRHRIENTKIDCEFLVAGFAGDDSPHLFSISDSGLSYHDTIGYWAIGTGAYSALSSLAFRGYHLALDFNESIYQVLEAKFMAESALGVGRSTTAVVIRKDGRVGMLPDAGIDAVRKIWDREGKPRSPRKLSACSSMYCQERNTSTLGTCQESWSAPWYS